MNESWLQILNANGAQFGEGRVESYSSIQDELAAAIDATVFCDLSHEGLIAASGEDAIAFLQGQLSNDVAALTTTTAQWNSWSSPKGRMLATFLMWRQHENSSDIINGSSNESNNESGNEVIYLQLPRSLHAAIQKRLSLFVLRSKVKLVDASDSLIKIGIADRNVTRLESRVSAVFGDITRSPMQTIATPLGRLIRLSGNRFEVVTPIESAAKIWQRCLAIAKPVGAPVWNGFAVRDGIITVLPETQDAFVAQMANFELIGGVNFKKGCYVGQEIIARTQYRGILKKRMVLVHGHVADSGKAGNPVPKPGDPVFAREFGDQVAGQIANVAPTIGGGFEALAVAQLESIKANSLRLQSLTGAALDIAPLPYSVL